MPYGRAAPVLISVVVATITMAALGSGAVVPGPEGYTCATCTALSSAGWCPSTNKCEYGSSIGPVGSACPATVKDGSWIWNKKDCVEVTATTCLDCTTNSESAGWCPAAQKCYVGNITAPTGVPCEATPDVGQWTWHIKDCAVLTASTCLACTADIGDDDYSIGAGWCPYSGRCLMGDVDGPYGTTCPNAGANGDLQYTFHHLDCPCESQSHCYACDTAGPDCGWCRSTQACMIGDSDGPWYGDACDDWVKEYQSC